MSTAQKPGKAPPVWAIRTMTSIHGLIHKLSGGKLMNNFAGSECCFVEMTGAKSGEMRRIPLIYVPHEDGCLFVGSQGGNPNHPAWYFNLVANPDCVVEYRGERRSMTTRLASTEEKLSLWPICDDAYAPYADYRTYTNRDIPVFICTPKVN